MGQSCTGQPYTAQSCQDLTAWQNAMDFVMDIYRTTKTFPRDDHHGLAGQLRRAAVAIPTNIAEGQARLSVGHFHFFLARARASLLDVETQLLMAQTQAYFTPEVGNRLLKSAADLRAELDGLFGAIAPAA
jgi:four helix bundle protein